MCEGPTAVSYRGQARREEEGSQEHKKPVIGRNDKIYSLVEGTVRDWIECFLSRVMAL